MTHLLASADAVLMEAVDLLRSDVTLMSRISGIYSTVPDAATLPYIVIHDVRVASADVQHLIHGELTFSLTIWSDAQGVGEVLSIAALLPPALEPSNFLLPQHTQLSAFYTRQASADIQAQGALHRMQIDCRAVITYTPEEELS